MDTGIFIGLGGNLGDRKKNLKKAGELLGLEIVRSSSLYETEPVGYLDQPWFLNAVIRLRTDLQPLELLRRCQEVERRLKRQRKIPMGPRSIDLDILFYGDAVSADPVLTLPHPAVAARRFVLVPLAEIAPDFVHPVLHKTIAVLLDECPDISLVRKL